MHYGEPLDQDQLLACIRRAYDRGIRTFLTADVYGDGAADKLFGDALSGLPRDTYCLAGMIGHDFYKGKRAGSKGYPRFTDPTLRGHKEYEGYLRMAVEESLARCCTDHFDCLLLHNPDSIGYSSDAVWNAMDRLRSEGMTEKLGIAPGPANGFTLDLLLNFERFGPLLDWAMIILNPFEPWPGQLCLPAAKAHDIGILTRVVDYGGLFHNDVKPGHEFAKHDHRSFRPAGWVEAAQAKLDRIRPIAEQHDLTPLQFACAWNLSQPPVKSVAPTMIQESGSNARLIEEKIDELAALPEVTLSPDELEEVDRIGDNTGCMELKGAHPSYTGEPLPDRWAISNDLGLAASRWHIDPAKDLVCTHTSAA